MDSISWVARRAVALCVLVVLPASVAEAQGLTRCRVAGRVTSGGVALPGVAVALRSGDVIVAVTSTGSAGEWALSSVPGSYSLDLELTGFTPAERSLAIPAGCDGATTSAMGPLDIQLTLLPRQAMAAPSRAGTPRAARFDTPTVQRTTGADAASGEPDDAAGAALSLPPGFSQDAAAQAVSITGANAATDRRALSDRAGLSAPDLGVRGIPGQLDMPSNVGRPGASAEQPIRRGGRPFRGGGRAGRVYSATTSYTVAGSALDSTPFQLRAGTPGARPDYRRQSVDFTVGSPLKIPRVYDGTRRTNLTLSYSAIRGDNYFDQYATVPTAAMRAGDFSALATPLLDPATGQAFAGNQVPVARFSTSSLALLPFLPLPNVDGAGRNFRRTATSATTQDNLQFRITHNFTPPLTTGVGAQGGANGGSSGSTATRALDRTTASASSNIQYRRNDNDRINLFPSLGGLSTGSSLTLPINLNVTHRRAQHRVNVTLWRSRSDTRNRFAFSRNVAAAAGIAGASTDPFDWGLPSLSFASLSSAYDLTPSAWLTTAFSASYSWSKWFGKQRIRFGGDGRRERMSGRSDANARGSFIFTGLYTGSDFADFLLGDAQQASVQYGPASTDLRSRSMSAYAEHEWGYSYFTFNSGVRYEVTGPYSDARGRMATLDVPSDFSAAVPVAAGGTGPFSGAFPEALIRTDVNNVMPRLGFAWLPTPGTTVRTGYGISFNEGSYSSLARQLSSQPPFAVTNTAIGAPGTPLQIASALTTPASGATNTFGVARDYSLGRVQTWNVDVARELRDQWNASGGYTYARGSGLDLVRAPNRGPSGLRIAGVQPFLWHTAEGSSRLHSATLRVRRRPRKGIGGGLSYTVARSMDDAASIGGGQTVVAQDEQNLKAEWGLSSFDRRHQLSANANVELPFGPNRRWANGDGVWSRLLEAWSTSVTLTIQTGTPLTVRALSASSDVARGTNGTLRADYNGGAIGIDHPGIDRFFSIAAFSLPAPGAFGTAPRNVVPGPGYKDLTAQVTRDIRLGGTRGLSVQVRAANLLNMVNYAAVDTIVNSPTFGQVTSVRPMRSVQINVRFRY